MNYLKLFSCSFLFYISNLSIALGISTSTESGNYNINSSEVIKRINLNRKHSWYNHYPKEFISDSKQSYFDISTPQKVRPLQEVEFLIDTNVNYAPAPNDQISASVAFDGTNYFVVWQDRTITGARVTQTGEILDPLGINISTCQTEQQFPSVAFDGINYLVVWQDCRRGYWDIYGARVNQFGEVLDTAGIIISKATDYEYLPSVAYTGSNYLVVWVDGRGYRGDIYGARVTREGNVLDTLGIAISTAINTQWFPSVTVDIMNFFVVWHDNRNSNADIYGARVTQSGTVLDPAGIPISTAPNNQLAPSVAFDGTNYLVVWQDFRNGLGDIYGTRVTQTGMILDTAGIAISISNYNKYSPAVVFNSSNYLVVWQDQRNDSGDIYAARVSQSGSVLDPQGFIVASTVENQYSPSVIFGGINNLIVWEDYRNGLSDIYGARADEIGTILDPEGFEISKAIYSQYSPAIAFDSTNYLIVWKDYRSGEGNIYGARVTASGTILDPFGIAISTAAAGQEYPSVAFDGTNYLVVWNDWRWGYDGSAIYAARVTKSGTVLDTLGLFVGIGGHWTSVTPSISFDGTNYLVVWESGCPSNICGARITQNGIVLDPDGFQISRASYYSVSNPKVAFDGTNFLVVWEQGSYPYYDIYGALVSQSGLVIDTIGIPISTAPYNKFHPSVAFDGINYLVVWDDNRYGEVYTDILGSRISQSGEVLDTMGIDISVEAGDQHYPAITFDGTNYIVIWQDERNDSTSDISGIKVSPARVVFEPFIVSTQSGNQCSPALSHGRLNQILITFSGWAGYINIHPAGVYRIWGKFYTDYLTVYPGDCNNDGVVNAIDVLPIGRFWHFTGIPRDSTSSSWGAHKTCPWSSFQATYADCNGDGEVNEQDVLAIGSNWHKNHTLNGEKFIINLENPELKNYIDNYKAIYNSIKGEDEATQEIKKVLIAIINKYSQLDQSFLSQIFPNPVISQCKIRFGLSKISKVGLKIYDISGQLVKTLIDGLLESGHHIGSWDGRDTKGIKVSNGIYLYRLTTNDFECTRSLIVLR